MCYLHMSQMSGKLLGVGALGTSCLDNPFCIERMSDDTKICSVCYAVQSQKFRKQIYSALHRNVDKLSRIIPEEFLPVTENALFRFEPFGDLICREQLINYVHIADKNPQTFFALWTKNLWFLKDVFSDMDKPDNMSVVVSSDTINKVIDIKELEGTCADVIYTVYDKDFIKENRIDVDCYKGIRCLSCKKCYRQYDTPRLISAVVR